MKNSDKPALKELTYLSLFAALICVGAYIKIPFAVPITLQFLFTNTAALTLGKRSAFSALAYVIMGLLGLPVFSSGGGVSAVLSLSFGFNIGFVIGAFFAGAIAEKSKGASVLALASFVNLIFVYLLGTVHFLLIQNLYLSKPSTLAYALGVCVLPFVLFDIAKITASMVLARKIKKVLR